jgi:hypothetical protein
VSGPSPTGLVSLMLKALVAAGLFRIGVSYLCAGKLMSSKELATKVEKLRPYLDGHGGHTVGGVTVSGGEALLQPEFVTALFMEAHARGLTTCLDTTGKGRLTAWCHASCLSCGDWALLTQAHPCITCLPAAQFTRAHMAC